MTNTVQVNEFGLMSNTTAAAVARRVRVCAAAGDVASRAAFASVLSYRPSRVLACIVYF
jgi:hypothetical protein